MFLSDRYYYYCCCCCCCCFVLLLLLFCLYLVLLRFGMGVPGFEICILRFRFSGNSKLEFVIIFISRKLDDFDVAFVFHYHSDIFLRSLKQSNTRNHVKTREIWMDTSRSEWANACKNGPAEQRRINDFWRTSKLKRCVCLFVFMCRALGFIFFMCLYCFRCCWLVHNSNSISFILLYIVCFWIDSGSRLL